MRCTRLAANTGRKKVAKNRHLGTSAQLCRAISSQIRHVSTIGKKLVKQQYLLDIDFLVPKFSAHNKNFVNLDKINAGKHCNYSR